ncbi:trace amine-associated receptor 6-like [Oncorhynchus clarkii lewisi]|uniref:trace amine-associated receptor 6-like n=1 Tax=Oncorhynchus clarkii lewisi TaxID=490388 RepID=UPI0039B8E317
MWQGFKTITHYKGKHSRELPSDTSLPDKLNHIYTRFEAGNTEACIRASAIPDDCVIKLSIANGCVLSPFLYSLFTHDCIARHESNTIIKFADDTTVTPMTQPLGRRKALLSTSIFITLYIVFSLISAVTVFLNLLVIISISHFKQLHTTTNLLILSLAASDLLVGLIVIPVLTVAIMEPCWGFGEYLCAFHAYISFLCTSLSLGNLVLISIDRYVAVCDPLLYHSKITTTRMMCCISVTWCCCIIYDAVIIQNFVNVQVPSRCLKECLIVEGIISVNIIYIVITMVVPCTAIITLYMKIFVVARSQARKSTHGDRSKVPGGQAAKLPLGREVQWASNITSVEHLRPEGRSKSSELWLSQTTIHENQFWA